MTARIGSLFSGYGGLDLAVEDVVGARTAWHCEIEAAPSRVLAAHWPGVPNHHDITAVHWPDVEPVDILTGGFPCQDVSHAGRRAGLAPGTRSGLWARMADAIDHLRPALVVAENVRGLLSAPADSDVEPCPWCLGGAGDGEPAVRALGAVLADLADLGYDAAWCGLRAADVGAPHGRFRVFVIAWPATQDADGAARGERGQSAPGQAPRGWARAHPRGRDRAHAPDADRAGVEGAHEPGGPGSIEWRELDGRLTAHTDSSARGRVESGSVAPGPTEGIVLEAGRGARRGGCSRPPTGVEAGLGLERVGWVDAIGRDADGRGGADRPWGAYEPAVRRWEHVTGRRAPAPTELGAKGQPRLSPAFVEWMMGLPAGWVTDVPGISRNDQLKMLGNGVVPAQAAQALRTLLGGDQ